MSEQGLARSAAYTYGVIMGQLASKGVPAERIAEVTAVQWKTRLALRRCTKDDSRSVAQHVFPDCADAFRCASAA